MTDPRTLAEFRGAPLQRVTIDQLGWRGEGLVRLADGWVVVPGALPGEVVEVAVHPGHPRSHRVDATVVEVIEASEDRVASSCAAFPRCRGCHLQHVSPAWIQAFKRQSVAEVLTKFGPIPLDAGAVSILGEPPENHARHRCNLVVREGQAGLISPSGLISMRDCVALTPACRAAVAELEDSSPPDGKIQLLVPDTGRAAATTSDALLDHVRANTAVAADAEGDARSVQVAAGHLTMEASLDVWTHGSALASAPLYHWLATWFAGRRGQRLLELGCGIGSVAAHAVAADLNVVGVDGSLPSIAHAQRNCPAAQFRAASFERACRELAMAGERFDVAVINPMREPVGERVLAMVTALGVQTVVYLAPSPASGAKDLRTLFSSDANAAWRLDFVGMVDLHPRTYHVMLVAVAQR